MDMINCLSQEEKNSILFSILSQIQSQEDLDELKRDLNKWNITRQICGDINKEESNKEEQEHDEDDDEEDEEPRCKKHDLYMYEDNQTKCSECCEELGEEYSGKYCGDIYGCGYTGLSEQCKLCVKCNPKLWWLERRPTKLPRKVKEFEDKNE